MYFDDELSDNDVYCEPVNAHPEITQFYPASFTLPTPSSFTLPKPSSFQFQWLSPQTLPPLNTTAASRPPTHFDRNSEEKYMPVTTKAVTTLCIGSSGIVLGLLGLLAYSMLQIPSVRHSLGKSHFYKDKLSL